MKTEKTIDEMVSELNQMFSTPPGICWKCGVDFFTMSPRNMCAKCLGLPFSIEPFSKKGILIGGVVMFAVMLPLLWWAK